MTSGLLERLGRRARGEPAPTLERAVLSHLRLLLNTRQGSSRLDPSYGMPDFTEIVHDVPGSLPTLQRMIAEAIKRSEPRLARVSVSPAEVDPGSLALSFEVRAQLVEGGTLRFATELTRGGHIRIGGT